MNLPAQPRDFQVRMEDARLYMASESFRQANFGMYSQSPGFTACMHALSAVYNSPGHKEHKLPAFAIINVELMHATNYTEYLGVAFGYWENIKLVGHVSAAPIEMTWLQFVTFMREEFKRFHTKANDMLLKAKDSVPACDHPFVSHFPMAYSIKKDEDEAKELIVTAQNLVVHSLMKASDGKPDEWVDEGVKLVLACTVASAAALHPADYRALATDMVNAWDKINRESHGVEGTIVGNDWSEDYRYINRNVVNSKEAKHLNPDVDGLVHADFVTHLVTVAALPQYKPRIVAEDGIVFEYLDSINNYARRDELLQMARDFKIPHTPALKGMRFSRAEWIALVDEVIALHAAARK